MWGFSLKDKLMLFAMCVMMVVVQFISSCTSSVTDLFSSKPAVELVGKAEPILIEEPKAEPVPQPKPEPKVDPKPEPKADELHGTIVMYTSDNCIWCTRWKSNELPKIRKANWKYSEIYVTDGPVPRFDIHFNGKVLNHTGYLDMASLRRIVEK